MPAQVKPDHSKVIDQMLNKSIPCVQIFTVSMHENKWWCFLLTLVSEMNHFPVW